MLRVPKGAGISPHYIFAHVAGGYTVNNQPIEKRIADIVCDGILDVHSIFLTIQGEGPFCGTPCVFVRLAGCNLQCPACDTDYTSYRELMSPYRILAEVNELWRKDKWRRGLVVVTGGEPFRQDLRELFQVLTVNGYYVQVETNGTLPPTTCEPGISWNYQLYPRADDLHGVYVVCSPKTGKIHPRIYDVACALKYVIKCNDTAWDGLPLSALGHPSNPYPARPPEGWDRQIYLQPQDDKDPEDNAANTKEAVASCLRHGYTLQLQIHKFAGVD